MSRLRHLLIAIAFAATGAHAQPLQNPILFVTQFPIAGDFTAIGSVFGNHRTDMESTGRGGDLMIRYPDGSLRNLTHEAGYGMDGQQGANAIAVRDPAVSWDGTRAIFSMVIGAPTQQYQWGTWYWQMYEVSGLGQGQVVHITKVANQPANFNNVSPTYLSDGSIAFVSDRPRNGAGHLYPQLDEYEEAPTPTGLWRLLPASGRLDLLQYAVSGSFNPIVDSYGRVLFTRWDHLQRDQQNDNANNDYGTFNWSSEASSATATPDRSEVFPEPRNTVAGSHVQGFTINHFFPWMVNQDGSGEETLNHVGRHELHGYFNRSFDNDPNLHEFIAPGTRKTIENMLQMREDPSAPGHYIGIDAPEFYTHASGQIIRIDAAPTVNPATMTAQYLTPRSTASYYDGTAPADFSGHYRNPLPLADGRMLAVHTAEPRSAGNDGTRDHPLPRYLFRLKRLATSGGFLAPVENMTAGISKSISYWDPDVLVSYNGPLWELSPVEVRARTTPPSTAFALQTPEQQAFTLESVDVDTFRNYLRANGLAVIVMRNVTTRDGADQQQPYNLRVPGGAQTVGSGGAIYDIAHMQFFQGDQIRGLGGSASPNDGRRVLAQTMHDPVARLANATNPGGPAGSAPILDDGSVALFVPALRAMAWHSTAANGTPVVRERYWISFQPGEIRACDGCHGVNQQNQAGQPAAQNTALAFRQLLARWRDHQIDLIFANSMEPR
jgi:hypothetical protein